MTLGIVDIATILLVTVGPLKALIVFAYAFAVVGAGAGARVHA